MTTERAAGAVGAAGAGLPGTRYAVPAGVRLAALNAGERARIVDRGTAPDGAIAGIVAEIIANVRSRGDAALIDLASRYDGVSPLRIEVPLEECRAALGSLEPEVRAALEEAARNIAIVHQAQRPEAIETEVRPGLRVGRRPDPIARVAVYAPGGRAAYPSSVLMGAIPARFAGVDEVIVCSPPGPDGRPPEAVLAACALAEVDRVFALGGAGAVAAAAYGTETVPAVDKIVGPGNAFVTEAKRQVGGSVATDMPAGPSEVLVVADDTANPERVAMELLAQAEHDPDAASVLVTTSGELLMDVAAVMDREVVRQPRREVVETALARRGALLLADTAAEMLEFASEYAPEHLALYVREPRTALRSVRNAGAVFLGDATSVAFGDYLTGGNHVLPTAAAARGFSGLGTLDFVRWTSYQEVDAAAAARLAAPTATLATVEGLPAHAAAAAARAGGANGADEADGADGADEADTAARSVDAKGADRAQEVAR